MSSQVFVLFLTLQCRFRISSNRRFGLDRQWVQPGSALITQSCSIIAIIRGRTGHVAYMCACVWHNAHPWQLAHSSSSIETSSRTVRVLRVTTTTSCPLPSHDATPVAAAAPDPTTPASGPHHTPLSTGAMMHHTGEDIWQVAAGETRNTQRLCYFFICRQWVSGCNYFFFGDTKTALSKWTMFHTHITMRVEESAAFTSHHCW